MSNAIVFKGGSRLTAVDKRGLTLTGIMFTVRVCNHGNQRLCNPNGWLNDKHATFCNGAVKAKPCLAFNNKM